MLPNALPGTVCRLFFGHSLGHSRDHNDLGCNSLNACRRGRGHSHPVFCHYTGLRVLIGIGPLIGTVPRPVAARSVAECAGVVLLADLANYTHTNPLCVIVSGITYNAFSSCILMWNGQGSGMLCIALLAGIGDPRLSEELVGGFPLTSENCSYLDTQYPIHDLINCTESKIQYCTDCSEGFP